MARSQPADPRTADEPAWRAPRHGMQRMRLLGRHRFFRGIEPASVPRQIGRRHVGLVSAPAAFRW